MNSAEIIDKITTLGKEGKLPFSLENCSLKSLRENGQNIPLKAGNKVLRVPKNGKESKAWADLERESQVTDMIQKQNQFWFLFLNKINILYCNVILQQIPNKMNHITH